MRGAGVMALVAALSFAASAAASPESDRADTLFREGRAAFDKGDYPTACARFEASQAAAPAPGTILNLAVCEEKTGKLVAARRHITEFLAAAKPKDDRLPFAKELQQKLGARIPTLTVTIAPGEPADNAARLEAGGEQLPVGQAIPLDPGPHAIVTTAAGRRDGHREIDLVEGAKIDVAVAAGASAVAAPTPPPPPVDDGAEGRNLRRTLGFVSGGVGIAGAGVAAATGIVLLSKKSDLDGHCPKKACDPAGVKLLAGDKSTPLVAVNMVGWIVAIAGLGGGTVLLLTSRAPAAPETAKRPAASAWFQPVLGPTYGGLGVDGKF